MTVRLQPALGSSKEGLTMPAELNIPDKVQVRLTSAVETILASLEPHAGWIEQTLGVPLGETLTLEVDCNPADAVAEELLQGLPIVAATKARNRNWRTFIEDWTIPPGVSPRISVSPQRERKPNAAPSPVWEPDWQDCPVAFRMRGLARRVISVEIPLVFPPADMPISMSTASTGSSSIARMPPRFSCCCNRCRAGPSDIWKRRTAAPGCRIKPEIRQVGVVGTQSKAAQTSSGFVSIREELKTESSNSTGSRVSNAA
jgi:hypothetical protein